LEFGVWEYLIKISWWHVVFALLLCKKEGISVTVQYVADFGSESSRNGTVRKRKGDEGLR
jgi:uncharacterized SAM-binding protein YcdF (DUF218 family)